MEKVLRGADVDPVSKTSDVYTVGCRRQKRYSFSRHSRPMPSAEADKDCFLSVLSTLG